MSFNGFPRATRDFLAGIAANNNKDWFTANRALYDATVEAAKDFVADAGPRLQSFAPDIRYEPKIGGSLTRVNNDLRFDKSKPPYKSNFDMLFWYGEKRSFDQPGFYLRLSADSVWIAAGMMHIMPPALYRFRDAIVDDRSGAAMVEAIRAVEAAGPCEIGFPRRKTVPKGYDKDGPRAAYLLWESFWALRQLPSNAALAPGFIDTVLDTWRGMAPIPFWLHAELAP